MSTLVQDVLLLLLPHDERQVLNTPPVKKQKTKE
jgi:hypothetical protein